MVARNLLSKISIVNYTKAKTKSSGLCFTSAASEFSETANGKDCDKENETPVASIADAEKKANELARKLKENLDGSNETSQESRDKGTSKVKDTLKDTWSTAKEATERVAGKAKEVVEDYTDVMRPAEEYREKVVDQREMDAVRRPIDERKN